MSLESSVRAIRKIRIATSISVAFALMIMGYAAMDPGMADSTRSHMFWLAVILVVLSVVIPISYAAYLAKKGPGIPPDEMT